GRSPARRRRVTAQRPGHPGSVSASGACGKLTREAEPQARIEPDGPGPARSQPVNRLGLCKRERIPPPSREAGFVFYRVCTPVSPPAMDVIMAAPCTGRKIHLSLAD